MELGIALQVLVGESRIPQDREGVHRAELSKREHLSTWNPGFPLTWAALAVVSLVPTVVGSRCTHRVPAWRNTTRRDSPNGRQHATPAPAEQGGLRPFGRRHHRPPRPARPAHLPQQGGSTSKQPFRRCFRSWRKPTGPSRPPPTRNLSSTGNSAPSWTTHSAPKIPILTPSDVANQGSDSSLTPLAHLRHPEGNGCGKCLRWQAARRSTPACGRKPLS